MNRIGLPSLPSASSDLGLGGVEGSPVLPDGVRTPSPLWQPPRSPEGSSLSEQRVGRERSASPPPLAEQAGPVYGRMSWDGVVALSQNRAEWKAWVIAWPIEACRADLAWCQEASDRQERDADDPYTILSEMILDNRHEENVLHWAAQNLQRLPGDERTRPEDTVYAQLCEFWHRNGRMRKDVFVRSVVMRPNLQRRTSLGEAICVSHGIHAGDRLVVSYIFQRFAMPVMDRGKEHICLSYIAKLVGSSDRRQSTLEMAAMIGAYDLFCKFFDLAKHVDFFLDPGSSSRDAAATSRAERVACLETIPFIPQTDERLPCDACYVRAGPDCHGQYDRFLSREEQAELGRLHAFYTLAPSREKLRAVHSTDIRLVREYQLSIYEAVRLAFATAVHMNHFDFVRNMVVFYARYGIQDLVQNRNRLELRPFTSEARNAALHRRMLRVGKHKRLAHQARDGHILGEFMSELIAPTSQTRRNQYANDIRSDANAGALVHSSFADAWNMYRNKLDRLQELTGQPVEWYCDQRWDAVLTRLAASILADSRSQMIALLLLLYATEVTADKIGEIVARRTNADMWTRLADDPACVLHATHPDVLKTIPLPWIFFGPRSTASCVPVVFALLGKRDWLDTYRQFYSHRHSHEYYQAPEIRADEMVEGASPPPIVWTAVQYGRVDILEHSISYLTTVYGDKDVAFCAVFFSMLPPPQAGEQLHNLFQHAVRSGQVDVFRFMLHQLQPEWIDDRIDYWIKVKQSVDRNEKEFQRAWEEAKKDEHPI